MACLCAGLSDWNWIDPTIVNLTFVLSYDDNNSRNLCLFRNYFIQPTFFRLSCFFILFTFSRHYNVCALVKVQLERFECVFRAFASLQKKQNYSRETNGQHAMNNSVNKNHKTVANNIGVVFNFKNWFYTMDAGTMSTETKTKHTDIAIFQCTITRSYAHRNWFHLLMLFLIRILHLFLFPISFDTWIHWLYYLFNIAFMLVFMCLWSANKFYGRYRLVLLLANVFSISLTPHSLFLSFLFWIFVSADFIIQNSDAKRSVKRKNYFTQTFILDFHILISVVSLFVG